VSHYTAETLWLRGEQDFLSRRYSRRHLFRFDGGLEVPGSSSPHVVRVPLSDPAAVDPEELLLASVSSCHMLWFLDIAARKGFVVDSYRDLCEGVMEKNAEGKYAVTVVTLRPEVKFSGEKTPTRAELDALHHAAHEECFIANSIRSEVRCEPVNPPGN
jgi:organic hydroperoxide reductase OsmC/OhrA